MTDDQIYDFWLHRECMDAIVAGDMRAQVISAARALLAAAPAAPTCPDPKGCETHGCNQNGDGRLCWRHPDGAWEPSCTEERPCINCFAGTKPCLGPYRAPAAPVDEARERDLFEAHFAKKGPQAVAAIEQGRAPQGSYWSNYTQGEWCGWRDRAQLVASETGPAEGAKQDALTALIDLRRACDAVRPFDGVVAPINPDLKQALNATDFLLAIARADEAIERNTK